MGPIQEAGLVEAWAFLLQAPDFRLDSCDLLRLLAGRRLQRNQVKHARCPKLLQAAWLHCARRPVGIIRCRSP